MSLLAKMKAPGPSGFGYGSTALDVVRELDLSGRTILLTGCNSGIGAAALEALVTKGATVVACARTVEKAQRVYDQVGGNTIAVACELSEPSSVRACIQEVSDRV